MTGSGICNNNHIRNRKAQGKLDSVAAETICKVDTKLEKRAKKNNISELENDGHSQYCSESNDTIGKVGHACWHKNWSCQKNQDQIDCNMLSLQQGGCLLLYLKEILSDGRDTDIATVSQNSPRNRSTE